MVFQKIPHMQSIQQLDDPKTTQNDQCVLQKANVFPSLSFLLPQIKELEAPRVPWAGRLKMEFSSPILMPKTQDCVD